MMGAFSAAAVIPSFETFSEMWNVSITQASYFVCVFAVVRVVGFVLTLFLSSLLSCKDTLEPLE